MGEQPPGPNGWQITPRQPLAGHSTDHLPAIRESWHVFAPRSPSALFNMFLFWGEGSPTKIDYRTSWYPYSKP